MSVFSENPYYHETIKRFIVAFGSFFSGITLETCKDGTTVQSIRVPIKYGPKNKWLELLNQRPDHEAVGVQVTLPRLSFEIIDYKYDAARKIGTAGNRVVGRLDGGGGAKVFNPVPYDLSVTMYSYTKDQDDALKILEQVLPYFAPHVNIEVDILPQFNMRKSIPIVLNNVEVSDNYEGSTDSLRTVLQTFNFTAKLDLFGPLYTSRKIIEHVDVNFFDDPEMTKLVAKIEADAP